MHMPDKDVSRSSDAIGKSAPAAPMLRNQLNYMNRSTLQESHQPGHIAPHAHEQTDGSYPWQ